MKEEVDGAVTCTCPKVEQFDIPQSNTTANIIHFNARSLSDGDDGKFAQLKAKLSGEWMHAIVAVTETWLKKADEDDRQMQVQTTHRLHCVSRAIGKGGGCALFVPNALSTSLVEAFDSIYCEALCARVRQGSKLFKIIVIYRPRATADSDSGIRAFISKHSTDAIPVTIVGDFNKEMQIDGYLQFVDAPTRRPQRVAHNILDLVLTKADMHQTKNDIHIGHPFANSDHNVVLFKMNTGVLPTISQEQERELFPMDVYEKQYSERLKIIRAHTEAMAKLEADEREVNEKYLQAVAKINASLKSKEDKARADFNNKVSKITHLTHVKVDPFLSSASQALRRCIF
jgi:hypothetical protein